MRVTNKMMAQTVQRNMHMNAQRMNRLHEQLSSGKKVSRPSEDAVAVSRSMALTAALARNEQFVSNIDDTLSWLNATDVTLGNVTDLLQRVRELVIFSANDLRSPAEREAVAAEVDQLLNHLVELGNMEHGGRHLFGGFRTTAPPYSRTGDTFAYQGDDGILNHEVSPFATVEANVHGSALFGDLPGDPGTAVFYKLLEVRDAIRDGDAGQLSGTLLGEVDTIMTNVLIQRSLLGARANRLETGRQRFGMEELNIRELRSRVEDIDYARLLTEFKMQESIYQASLATAARVITPTLLQFLS
ncbi:MAG: Flagellar hook-associated protein 3 [Syntrophomonadaceae bacterium]|nr:Flagellar hook-associated protein 3 [Bacillota bacterium]